MSTMKLYEAYRFVRIKKLTSIVISSMPIESKTISNINKALRKCFIGNGADSIRAFEKDKDMIIVKMSFKGAKMSFIVPKFTFKEKKINEIRNMILMATAEVYHVTT